MKERVRHAWVTHGLAAVENYNANMTNDTDKIPAEGDYCSSCEKFFTRKDNLKRHKDEGRCKGRP